MLKRILGILLCSTVVLIPSCTSGERRREGDHALYFLRSSYEDSAGSGALAAEWVALEAGDTQSQARQLVERLLAGLYTFLHDWFPLVFMRIFIIMAM